MPSRESFAYRRALKLRAVRAVEENSGAIHNVFARAQDDFLTFCTLMDKPPAQHMLEWHRELITGQSNRYLLDIAGPNTDILSPRGSAKSTVLNLFTAWCIGRHTAAKRPLQIIYVSYNVATAIPKSRIIKQIVDSATFKKIFPTCRLKPGMQSDIGWSIDFDYAGIPRVGDEEFTLRAAGLRGSITSKRAHLCLTGDTLVTTDQGQVSLACIYEHPERYRVAVRNQRTHNIDWCYLGAVTRRRSAEIIRIETTCGSQISATAEHPFLASEGGYKRAGDLNQGQTLIGLPSGFSASRLPCLRQGEKSDSESLFRVLEQSRTVPNRPQVPCLQKVFSNNVETPGPEVIDNKRHSHMFTSLCGGSKTTTAYFVQVLPKNVCASLPIHKVLFKDLQRTESQPVYAGGGQFKLPPRELHREFQSFKTPCAREGQFHLRRMQYEGEKVSFKRWVSTDKSLCSSHRSHKEQQYSFKFNNTLSSMPCSSSSDYRQSWETLTISRVTRDCSRTQYVYDLEVDHPDHNFIANNYVVGNCIVDDPIKSSTDIRNPAIRDEQNTNWSSVIAPIIFEGGRSICLGTRFHPLDIHKTMFIPSKGWKQVVQEALTYDDNGEPISYWPEQWSVDYLLQQKELDPVAFAFQYQQQPVMTSDLVLSPDLIVKGEVVTEFDSLAVGIDLSASKNETSDYTAFVMGGRLKDNYYIIDAHQVRSIGNLEKIDLLCDMLVEWGILQFQNGEFFPTYSTVTLVVESVAYQASLAADLRRVLLNERGLSNLNIHEVKGFRGDKIARFRGTLGLLENKKVIFNKYRKFDTLVDQLINIGATSHDDLLDAYTWLMTYLQRRGNFSIEY
jgi:phage terminase large subunit-like protein